MDTRSTIIGFLFAVGSIRAKSRVRQSSPTLWVQNEPVPTVLSTFAWRWMFDPTFSVLNWALYHAGFITTKLPFLSDGAWASARLMFTPLGFTPMACTVAPSSENTRGATR